MITNEVMTYLNMLCSRVLKWIFCNILALMLSHWMGTFFWLMLKLCNCCIIHRSWAQHVPRQYTLPLPLIKPPSFASWNAMKQAISQGIDKYLMCFSYLPCNLHNLHQKYSTRGKSPPLEYQSPKFFIPTKYLNIRLTVVRWDSLGDDWNRAHKHILNIISGQLQSS